jgi:hypothetical protein
MSLRFDWRPRLLCLIAFSALALPAQTFAEDLPACMARELDADVLNPDGDLAKRLATLEAIEKKDILYWRHIVGNLYRLGRDHPAALVDQDLAKAEQALLPVAQDGYLYAMADMAETKLAAGDPVGAMVWARIYTHYKRKTESWSSDVYSKTLIKRVRASLGRSRSVNQEVDRQVSAFIAARDLKVKEGDRSESGPVCRDPTRGWPVERAEGDDERIRSLFGKDTRAKDAPGLVFFEIWINPEGRVVSALVLDTLPDKIPAESLKHFVKALRYNPVSADAPLRRTLVPIFHDGHPVVRR